MALPQLAQHMPGPGPLHVLFPLSGTCCFHKLAHLVRPFIAFRFLLECHLIQRSHSLFPSPPNPLCPDLYVIAGLPLLDGVLHEGQDFVYCSILRYWSRTYHAGPRGHSVNPARLNEWVVEFLLPAWSHTASLTAELRLGVCLHVPFPEWHAVTDYPFSFPVIHEPTVQATLIHSLLPQSNEFFSTSCIRT